MNGEIKTSFGTEEVQVSKESLQPSSNSHKSIRSDASFPPEKIHLNLKNHKEPALESILENKSNLYLNLEELNISFCDLLKVPNAIINFKYLMDLNLSNNFLKELPEEIKNLQNLATLNLSNNKLSSLPKSLRHIPRLTCLNISHNQFVEVPEVLYVGLRVLKILDMSHNSIVAFNDSPECLNKIIELRMCNNALEKVPAWIFNNLCQLKLLDLSENPFTNEIEPNINYFNSGIFETLQVLYIENCNYRYENIGFLSHFKNIEVLHLGNTKESAKSKGKNYLESLKGDIFKNLWKIKKLNMQNVGISLLPVDFDYLKSIVVLNVSENTLSWLPDSFCNLITLEVVFLTSNQLLFLPSNIDNLVNLQQIHLGNNKLCELPESFIKLNNLEFIDLYNNKIDRINPSIILGKKLKGVDLELNCLDFSSVELMKNCSVREQYDCLKNYFRKHFSLLDNRCDFQTVETHADLENGRTFSLSSSQDDISLLSDDSLSDVHKVSPNCNGDDQNWEELDSCQIEDEPFDPNSETYSLKEHASKNMWTLHFKNNFCPANNHVRSLRNVCLKNLRLSCKNEVVEGQFDCD